MALKGFRRALFDWEGASGAENSAGNRNTYKVANAKSDRRCGIADHELPDPRKHSISTGEKRCSCSDQEKYGSADRQARNDCLCPCNDEERDHGKDRAEGEEKKRCGPCRP